MKFLWNDLSLCVNIAEKIEDPIITIHMWTKIEFQWISVLKNDDFVTRYWYKRSLLLQCTSK